MSHFLALNGTGTSVAFGNTLTFTTSRTINAGEHVVVATGASYNFNTTGYAITAISVGALTLGRDQGFPVAGNNWDAEVWSAHASSSIASGATVTVTLASSQGSDRSAMCFSLQNIAASSYVDSSGTNSGSGTSQTVATTGEATADGLAVAVLVCGGSTASNAGGSEVPASSYTQVSAPISRMPNAAGGSPRPRASHSKACLFRADVLP